MEMHQPKPSPPTNDIPLETEGACTSPFHSPVKPTDTFGAPDARAATEQLTTYWNSGVGLLAEIMNSLRDSLDYYSPNDSCPRFRG